MKLPATDPASRAAGQLGYRCETTFYREVANRLQLDIPSVLFRRDERVRRRIHARAGGPCTRPVRRSDCRLLCGSGSCGRLHVAGLHAPTWNDPSLRDSTGIPDLAAHPEVAATFLVDATKQFLERYAVTSETAATLHHFADRFVDWAAGRPEPFGDAAQ